MLITFVMLIYRYGAVETHTTTLYIYGWTGDIQMNKLKAINNHGNERKYFYQEVKSLK